MTTDLFRLVYCSQATIPADDTLELSRILAVSRSNNVQAEVTGAMLHNQGCFAQVLEGPLGSVQEVFERIQCDVRHNAVVVLQAERVGRRLFRAWDMALVRAADPAGVNALLRPALADPSTEAGAAVVDLLGELVCREDHRVF